MSTDGENSGEPKKDLTNIIELASPEGTDSPLEIETSETSSSDGDSPTNDPSLISFDSPIESNLTPSMENEDESSEPPQMIDNAEDLSKLFDSPNGPQEENSELDKDSATQYPEFDPSMAPSTDFSNSEPAFDSTANESPDSSSSNDFEPLEFDAPSTEEVSNALTNPSVPAQDEFKSSNESFPDSSESVEPQFEMPNSEPANDLDTMEQIRETSETQSSTKAYVAPSEPFSVLIKGPLDEFNQGRLLSIISDENLGIREVDLEPQFKSNKVLIPRVSEFAGILIVQALRDAPVSMTLGPADEVYSSSQHSEDSESSSQNNSIETQVHTSSTIHPAMDIPLIPSAHVPGVNQDVHYEILDGITSSLKLETQSIEAKNSMEYSKAVEALQRSLKYKAHRLGAKAVIHFKINLTPLKDTDQYRISAFGTAVKF